MFTTESYIDTLTSENLYCQNVTNTKTRQKGAVKESETRREELIKRVLEAKTGTKKENLCSSLQLFPFHFSLSKNESYTLSLADHIHLHVHVCRNSFPRVVLSLVGSFFLNVFES